MRINGLSVNRAPLFILLAVLVSSVVSCRVDSDIENRMNHAERIMENFPDSALRILQTVDQTKLDSDREKARFSLLMSQALDKNFIDTASFDVLQPAIDYYLEKGDPDEKLKTYHYQGCIYYQAGENDKALQAFLHGEELRDEITDTLAYARLLSAMAQIYYDAYEYEKYTQLYLKAGKICENLNLDVWYNMSLLSAVNGCLLLHDKNRCDSILSICQERVGNNRMEPVDLYPYQLTYKKLFGSKDDLQKLLSSGEYLNGLNTETMLTIADAYRRVGDYGSALDCLDSIVASGLPYNKRKYMAVRTMLYEGEGDYRKALIYYRVNSDSLFSDHVRMQEQRLKINKEKHDAEMQVVKTKNRMDRLFFISLTVFVALSCVVITLFFMVRGQKLKKEIAIQKARNVELENLKLRDAVTELEKTRDSLAESLSNQNEELSEEVRQTVKTRIEMLNSILASQISANDRYEKLYEKWAETLLPDTSGFMNSNRLAFEASHPSFIKKLRDAGLTTDEINYACLYALGLNGKEVGNYMQRSGHVNISSGIRKKLGLDKHATNINIFIRNLVKES